MEDFASHSNINVEYYVKLLHHLYKQSKHLPVAQSQPTVPSNTPNKGQETSTFEYAESLVSFLRKRIRFLRIDVGFGESCHLEVRDLYADDIDEALSYVWGECRASKSIWIDGRTFIVTKSLYELLLFLHYPDRSRTVWVDAVCINQPDLDKKALRVCHMDETYLKASKTIIWLSGQTLLDSPHHVNPENILAPLPTNFGGHTVHQYDLVGVLKSGAPRSDGDRVTFSLGIDFIRAMGTIPDFSNEFSVERLSTFLKDVLIQRNWAELEEYRKNGSDEYEIRISSIESVCKDISVAIVLGEANEPAFTDLEQALLQTVYLDQGSAFLGLFSLGEISSFERIFSLSANAHQRRLKEVSGMQYFVTKKELVGIATAPVTEGDVLAVIHAAPAYFVLREVTSNHGHVTQQHRMVARAVLSKTKEKIKEMFADLETRNFEIV
ncbi:hypothetical protein FHL15_006065 [Xylaria flabelliformis]|uniref:Heterokaryon incompatibility domain-containing protein n=1 Tax=Xylaria flabelliformis TaxID=2512241 RepID=A0A553HYA2_9PEZI|nr:hypothetical protein FHL15_006065 [Xylaria flabelliformis]